MLFVSELAPLYAESARGLGLWYFLFALFPFYWPALVAAQCEPVVHERWRFCLLSGVSSYGVLAPLDSAWMMFCVFSRWDHELTILLIGTLVIHAAIAISVTHRVAAHWPVISRILSRSSDRHVAVEDH